MTAAPIDVIGVGNAIVDVIAHASDAFLDREGLVKGSMALIDQSRATTLYERMGPGIEASGGSVANTMAGLASFGADAAFIGKVADDQLGKFFGHDMQAVGVDFVADTTAGGLPTGRCLILVTPDAQRTLNTYLGISTLLQPADIDEDAVAAARILFCEGYLWDVESAKNAIRRAMAVAGDAGRQVALTVSDSFCVERHHTEFLELIDGPVDILFANEAELGALYDTDFSAAVEIVRSRVAVGCLTRGAAGSLLVRGDETVEVRAGKPIPRVVDTTGAGDQYAAGALYGLARGLPLAEVGRLAAAAATEVISHVGPRPEIPLRDLI
ncbi:MAG: adenosine kinase [Acidimicrobiales bacterium]